MDKLLIVVCIICVFISCSTSDNIDKRTVLKDEYNALIQKLKKDNVKLTKYIIKDEKKDTLYLDTVNWEQELSLFIESDISKKKTNGYKITSFQDSCKFLFQTTSDKQPVKKLKYSNCGSELIVNIDVEKVSKLYKYLYYLELTPTGYLIEIKQEVDMAYESQYVVEGKFRK